MTSARTALLVGVLLFCGALPARGGDGGDYSGGGSDYGGSSSGSDWGSSSSSSSDYGYGDSGSGGSGGGDAELIIALLFMAVLITFVVLANRKQQKAMMARARQGDVLNARREDHLKLIRAQDPNFSPVLFMAFAHLVFVQYHESRGGLARRSKDDFAVAPYLHERLAREVAESKEQIARVIVGDMRVTDSMAGPHHCRVNVRFKANIVYAQPARRVMIQQAFEFVRAHGALTRPPESVLALGCPSCGSRQEPEVNGRCPQCGQSNARGKLDWRVSNIKGKPPKPVTQPVGQGGGVEVGTDLPTIRDPLFASAERELRQRDPAFSWDAFHARVLAIFRKLQEGWTMRDESILRPYELDHVYDTHRIWLERYREEGTRNVLENVQVDSWEKVKVEGDAWFDAITVRIFASMIDYNIKEDGTLVSGSKTKRKSFSEYFTLVRRTAHKPRPVYDPLKCPQCGAPLDRINQHGICGYCNTRVVTGDFDWVLAQITQDEEYGG